jgi:fibronectin type 3 domain-containing protein
MPVVRTLSWTANTESNLAGYKVYAGTRTGVYDDGNSPQDVGNVTSATFTPAHDSTRFYAVTAYDTEALESEHSDEVEYVPPVQFFG